MEQIEQQVRTKFRFVKENNLTVDNKHKEIGLFSISEKSLSIGIGGNSYIYLPSIETLSEDFVNKISYTSDMLNKADVSAVYTKEQVDEKITQAIVGSAVDLSVYYTKSETYSQTEVDDKLLLKADTSLVYTKSEVDDLIDLIPNFDSSLYYKKTEVDDKIDLKLDASVYNSEKSNYVLKTDMNKYYLKTDIDSKLDKKVNVDGYEADKLTFATKSELASKADISLLNSKLDTSVYTRDKATFATKQELANKLDVSTYNNEKSNFATKSELNLKLDASVYNSEKSSFANKSELTSKADDSKIGNLQNTGLTGSTVTELLKDAKTKIDSINTQGPVNLSNYYTKAETYKKDEIDTKIGSKLDTSVYTSDKATFATKDELKLKLDASIYNTDKATYATKSELANKADSSVLNSKLDTSVYTSDKATFATKQELANKADSSVLNSKLDTSVYTRDKATFATKQELANKANVSDLDAKLDESVYTSDKATFATKSELASKADSSLLSDKLDTSTYNSDKLTYALKTDLSDINIKLEKLNNSIRPVLTLTEDTTTVEGQSDKQTWLTQKLKTEKHLDPENGLVIITSDGDSYFYFNNQWILRKTYKVSHVTDTVMGIVKSKSDKGYGYIKASPSNDGTMVLTDYQDIISAVNLKADGSELTTLSGKVSKLEGTLAQKADSSTIGDLSISGLSGSNVTELLTSVKSNLDLKATKDELTSNYYNSATIDSKLDAKLNNNALDSYYDATHIDDNFATKSELANKVDNNTLAQKYYNKTDVDQKITQAVTSGQVDLSNYYTKAETYSQTQADGKFALISKLDTKADKSSIGDLRNTGLTGSTVTELLKDAKTKIDNINIGNYYDKSYIDSNIATKVELANKVDNGSFDALRGKVTTLEGNVSSKVDVSKIGDLSNTGFTGSSVTELLKDAKTKIDNISIGNYYNKSEVDDKLKSKLDASEISKYYLKTETYSQSEADGKFATKQEVGAKADDSKVGNLSGTGLTGLSVTELLTNAKSEIDLKAAKTDVTSLTSRVGALEGEMANKLNSSALDDYYNESTIDSLLANKANQSSIGNLQNTGLTGTTVTELLTDAKTKIDNINIGNYYTKSEVYTKGEVDGKLSSKLDSSTASSTYATKSELASKADSSLLSSKLDTSTYNSEKSGFATTRSIEELNEKIERLNNSIRPVLMLSENTATVEGQSNTQTWLTQKLKTDKQLDPENGLVIITSDGDSYFYFNDQWILRKTYKVGSATNSTSGVVLGKDEAGHGYIKASDALDGTMVLVDYQNIVDSIRTKAENSTVTTLEGKVRTIEGQLSNKVDNSTLSSYYTSSKVDSLLSSKLDSSTASSTYATKGEVSVKANQSSIGDLQNTGLTGTTVTELLTDAKTKIDNINIENYYPKNETYSRTEISGLLSSKADTNNVLLNNTNQTINGLLTSTSGFKVEKSNPYIQLVDTTGNKTSSISTIENGTHMELNADGGSGCIQISGTLRYKDTSIPTVSNDNEIPSYKQIKDEFATVSSLNSKANDNAVVKLTGDQSIAGNKTFTSKLEIDANNEVLKLKNTSNTSNYIAGYEGNTRIYYIGKDASNSIDLSIKNEYSVNGWITLKTKSKFDQAYTITDNEQIVHKKYVDDTINTNCVKLTGNQTIAGDKTISGFSKFINFVDVDLAPNSTYPFMMRFVGDKWSPNQSADLFRFHKWGGVCGYKVYLTGSAGFSYAELWGLTLISNMKDPTEDSHGANKRYVDNAINNNALPKATTNATNTIQVSNSGSKYFNFDYVLDGTGYRNWSGIQLRAKRNPNDFETMWKVEYRAQNSDGLFMTCIGNKLSFDSDTKIIGVSCEDSDGEKTAASKKYVDDKINTEISQIKSKIKEIVAQSTDFNDFKTKIQNW